MNKILSMTTIMLLATLEVSALGTVAGTQVDNSASLSFSVAGVAQTAVNSNTDTFVVDKKIDFVLTNNDGDQVVVVPGDMGKITTWSITNEGNLAQNFSFTAAQLTAGESIYADVDNQDSEALALEYSTDGGGTWNPLTSIEVAIDATVNIQIKTDIASTRVDGDVMNIKLEAVAVTSTGTPETATAGADTANSVDVVLAEAAGATGDVKENGSFVAWGGYIVNAPNLSLLKSSCVLEDIVNGVSANAKRIPGATVLYILDIHNSGTTTDATNVTISDTLASTLDVSTISNLKSDDGQTAPCSCANGTAYAGGTAATNTGTGSTLKVEGLTITKDKHNCVSFEVDIL